MNTMMRWEVISVCWGSAPALQRAFILKEIVASEKNDVILNTLGLEIKRFLNFSVVRY